MNVGFFYFLISLLIPRLITQWDEKPVAPKKLLGTILTVILVEAMLLIPVFTFTSFAILAILILIYHSLQFVLERNGRDLILKRIFEFVFLLVAGSFVFGTFADDIRFNKFAITAIKSIISNNVLLVHLNVRSLTAAAICLVAILTLINEMNHVVRYVLALVKTEPQIKKGTSDKHLKTDDQELRRGKIIGVIERILFFFLVITDNYAAIAFILTAKGITRYKELDDKNFAEYVLIGTLLSSALSIFWSYYMKELLNLI